MSEDDLLIFVDEPSATQQGSVVSAYVRPAWKVLIIDDDQDVHRSTELGLSGAEILGRSLAFLHAYSAQEGREVLEQERDIAVILLDVVMETEDAGLRLVDDIRNRYKLHATRIILRTGQPGYAPELEAIRDYDINDYCNKSELTRSRMYAAMTTAIRSYMQIKVIEAARIGLTKIVKGSAELMQAAGLAEFAAGVITQISALLGLQPEGLVCACQDGEERPVIIAAAGRFEHTISHSLDTLESPVIRRLLEQALFKRQGVVEYGVGIALHFGNVPGKGLAAYLDAELVDGSLDADLIEVFCTNVSFCLDNVSLIQRLNVYSYYDQLLLGMPNRRFLIELLDRHLAEEGKTEGLLVLVDIDHFGEINGALGHRFGDSLLKAVAERLKQHSHDAACIARVGSDTFAVVWLKKSPKKEALSDLFSAPLVVDGNLITVSATIGLVELNQVHDGGNAALEDAFLALKQAKRAERGGLISYSRHIGDEIRDRVTLLNELRRAFAEDHLFLVYQPQVELKSGRCVGAEALLRWRMDDGTIVPPDRFIGLAEYSGMITTLGDWVVRNVCHQAVEMEKRGFNNIRMAVNVSAIQFRDLDFLKKLKTAVEESGVHPGRIELEITESVAMDEAGRMIDQFDQIKAMGFGLAIDDFGTGFSSLSYLQQMRVDRLKIDRVFVSGLGGTGKGAEIAELICGLGSRLDLELVAEGIETEAQAAELKDMGCQFGQGWLYARPMPADAWLIWLEQNVARYGAL